MLLLRAFLRNLAVVLVLGSIGLLALRLPFSPWVTASLYAAAVAALPTWGECAPPINTTWAQFGLICVASELG